MKNKKTYVQLSYFFLFLVTILSCNIVSKEKSNDNCKIGDVLIDITSLPGNQWSEFKYTSFRDVPLRLGIDRGGTSFEGPEGALVREHVHLFRNESDAISGYKDLDEYWFGLAPEEASWSQPAIPRDISINANAYHLECSTIPSIRTCMYVARYGKTAIALQADMNVIENQDLFNIIMVIDREAQACTSKNNK